MVSTVFSIGVKDAPSQMCLAMLPAAKLYIYSRICWYNAWILSSVLFCDVPCICTY
jgi:hypothetical protein